MPQIIVTAEQPTDVGDGAVLTRCGGEPDPI